MPILVALADLMELTEYQEHILSNHPIRRVGLIELTSRGDRDAVMASKIYATRAIEFDTLCGLPTPGFDTAYEPASLSDSHAVSKHACRTRMADALLPAELGSFVWRHAKSSGPYSESYSFAYGGTKLEIYEAQEEQDESDAELEESDSDEDEENSAPVQNANEGTRFCGDGSLCLVNDQDDTAPASGQWKYVRRSGRSSCTKPGSVIQFTRKVDSITYVFPALRVYHMARGVWMLRSTCDTFFNIPIDDFDIRKMILRRTLTLNDDDIQNDMVGDTDWLEAEGINFLSAFDYARSQHEAPEGYDMQIHQRFGDALNSDFRIPDELN